MFVPNTVPLLETVDEGGEGWTLGMQHNVAIDGNLKNCK